MNKRNILWFKLLLFFDLVIFSLASLLVLNRVDMFLMRTNRVKNPEFVKEGGDLNKIVKRPLLRRKQSKISLMQMHQQ